VGASVVVPVAQAASERLALTVAALIAVAVLAVLGGLLVIVFRREARAHADVGPAPAGEPQSDRRSPRGPAGPAAPVDAPPPAAAGVGGPNGAARAAEGAEEGASVVRPPFPADAWTAEITWVAEVTRFRVLARRDDDLDADPVVLAQTEALPWPPTDQASVQALGDASAALEAALLESGWRPLPTGSAWYAMRFAWEPRTAGRDVPRGPGRFGRSGAPAPDPVASDAPPRRG